VTRRGIVGAVARPSSIKGSIALLVAVAWVQVNGTRDAQWLKTPQSLSRGHTCGEEYMVGAVVEEGEALQ
jgi:hypothetical protein